MPGSLSSLCRGAVVALLLGLSPAVATAKMATVAVAANFTTTLEKLAARFEETSGHYIRIVSGSTGKLYTQITRGAPFDIFLAADAARPERLMAEGRARGVHTYAQGRLVLWSRKGDASEALLRGGTIDRLAIANPDLAPYGVAAMEVLAHYDLTDDSRPALVMGENVGQAIAMLATGNVEYGLVPLSMRAVGAFTTTGTLWTIPADAHAPIRQDAVLLTRGENNEAAIAFFAYLDTDAAREIIHADGYEHGEGP